MKFLSCNPNVFVIDDCYEILLFFDKNGVAAVEVAGEIFYEENSGVLSTEKNYFKIRIPKDLLNENNIYKVIFNECINRKAYFSEMGEKEEGYFTFKPIKKDENINIYHVADVHHNFDLAKKTCSYFGNDLDLLVVNGDIAEVETLTDYFKVASFIGDITKGMIPVIFSRGNHDTRGKLAERFTDIFPSNGKKTYYEFNIGPISGLVLDCGEDKLDNHPEYGGVNVFERFRKEETKFLQKLTPKKEKIKFAVCHICPFQTTLHPGDAFDNFRDIYEIWNTELSRLGMQFMLSAHMHKAYLLEKHSSKALIDNEIPVIVGSERLENEFLGCALTINKDDMHVRFTNSLHQIKEKFVLKF